MSESKADYLKRYLGDEKNTKPGKKKKSKHGRKTNGSFRIIDMDADVPPPDEESEGEELYETKADLPAVEIDAKVTTASKFVASSWSTVDAKTSAEPRYDSASDDEPVSRRRYDSDDNEDSSVQPSSSSAPPRNGIKSNSQNSDDDLSPPRQKSKLINNPDDGDLSPPRQRRRKAEKNNDDNLSPPRKRTEDSGLKRESSDSDLSPRRKRHKENSNRNDWDLSPPRRCRDDPRSLSAYARNRDSNSANFSSRSGIADSDSRGRRSSGHSLRHSSERQPTKETRYDSSDGEPENKRKPGGRPALGGNDEAIVRKSYQKKKRKKELTEEEQKQQALMEERYAKWGKGTKQLAETEERVKDALADMAAPLARYSDDERMNEALKGKEYEEDPMAAYFKKKKTKKAKFIYPVYQGPPPPENRFKIRPGYRWDGVDRSNGFESRLIASSNRKIVEQSEYNKFMHAFD